MNTKRDQARIKSRKDIAAKLGISIGTFNTRRPAMEAQGFPLYDNLLRGYDEKAVDLWLDRRANITPASSNPTDEADRALEMWERGRQNKSSL